MSGMPVCYSGAWLDTSSFTPASWGAPRSLKKSAASRRAAGRRPTTSGQSAEVQDDQALPLQFLRYSNVALESGLTAQTFHASIGHWRHASATQVSSDASRTN